MVALANELCSGLFESVQDVKKEWKIRLHAGVVAEAARAEGASVHEPDAETHSGTD